MTRIRTETSGGAPRRVQPRGCRAPGWIEASALVLLVAAGAGCHEAPQAGPVLPGDPLPLAHAEGFRLYRGGGYQVLEVTRPWPGSLDTLRFALVPRGTPAPAGFAPHQIVRTPADRIVALSTTHAGMLGRLQSLDRLVGLSGTGWVYAPALRRRVAEGGLAEVGRPGGFDIERIAALRPDVVLASSLSAADYGALGRLAELGLPVVPVGEFAESTPLGQAEWLRVFGALVGREGVARAAFEATAARYDSLRAIAREADIRPRVFSNAAWRGSWFVAGGESFAARLFEDAGAAYLWADAPTEGTLQLDLEAVFAKAAEADVWLNPGAHRSRASLAAADARYTRFGAWQAGAVFNNDARLNPAGGNDYWESGPAHPDRVLADLVHIFHPDRLPAHRLYYYRRLPAR